MKYQIVAAKVLENSDKSESVICETDSGKDAKTMVGIYRNAYSAAYRIYKRKKKSYHPNGPSVDNHVQNLIEE